MATVMSMRWEGVTPEQYAAIMDELGLDENPADGAIFHVAGFEDGAIRVIDVWDSQAQFEQFMGERLQSAVQAAGVEGQPDVVYYDVHNVYAPRGGELVEQGSSSKP